jgi:chemotaxis protein methyltransferase CheR
LYLSHPLRRQIFDDLAQALRPGGLLVLGASETVIGQTDALIPCRTYRGFYRRALEARPLNLSLMVAR